MSILTQGIKDIEMIWMLGCLIISTFINHGVGRSRCSLGSPTRIWYGNEAAPRKYSIIIHNFFSIGN